MTEELVHMFFEAALVIAILTMLNFIILALSFKLYTEMFKQIAQDKRKEATHGRE